MANPEHLKILKQGVEAWNKWRKENPHIRPDLSKADLAEENIEGANLHKADLRGVDLSNAILVRADLCGADLTGANLSIAELYEADLSYAKLIGTDLSGAGLREAYLCGVDLSGTDISGIYPAGPNLLEANLSAANLRNANLRSTNLYGVDLYGADLEKARLEDAELRFCNLVECDLTGAVLTGVKLYGTARDNWKITDVECKYVYWDEKGERRSPKDRDLKPGEFERLYAALPTVEYVFEEGMSPIDPLIMDRVVQAIRERQTEFDINIDSINARGLAPSIKFTVQREEHRKPALEAVQREYGIKLRQLESERDRYYQLLAHALDAPKEVKLINAAPGSIVSTDGSTVSVEQHIHNALELQKAITDEPEESESFSKVAKKAALDIVSEVIKDVAKGQVKEAARQILELGKDLGPLFVRMAPAAYEFFKNIGA